MLYLVPCQKLSLMPCLMFSLMPCLIPCVVPFGVQSAWYVAGVTVLCPVCLMLVIMIVFFTSILQSSTGSSLLPGYDESRVSLECPWSVLGVCTKRRMMTRLLSLGSCRDSDRHLIHSIYYLQKC